jgi:hypothetical protein
MSTATIELESGELQDGHKETHELTHDGARVTVTLVLRESRVELFLAWFSDFKSDCLLTVEFKNKSEEKPRSQSYPFSGTRIGSIISGFRSPI